jgi:capsular exopolysaccharide synthesis family protein
MRNLPTTRQDSQLIRNHDVEYVLLPEEEGVSGSHFWDYVNTIRRRKRFVIIPFFIVMPLILLDVATKKPVYRATATLLIEKVGPKILSIEEVLKPEPSPDFYGTQYEILQSRAIAEQVVDALQLHKKPPQEETPLVQQINRIKRFPRQMISAAVSAIEALLQERPAPVSPAPAAASLNSLEQQRQNAITQLHSSLQVQPKPGTQLVDVTLDGRDPDDVARQVNMVAEAYVRQNLENKLDASRKAMLWLRKEARVLKEKIHNAELAIQDFKAREKFISPDRFETTQNLVQVQLNALQSSYVETNAAQLSLHTRINQLRKSSRTNLEEAINLDASLANNPLIQSLQKTHTELKIQRSDISKKFGYKHPTMKKIESDIHEVDNTIHLEVQKVINGLQEQYNMLVSKGKMLARDIESQRKDLYKLSDTITKYNELTRELEVDKELHQAVSKRLAETTLTEALETNNVKVVERAAVPGQPASSGLIIRVVLGVMVALGCGVGFALMTERLDKRFKTTDEAERFLSIPFLGCIPHYKPKRHRPVALYEPWSSASEAYRMLRTWLQLSAQQRGATLMLTSAVPNEGKSTIAANLAVSFAQLGHAVLLMDVDLRRPTVQRLFPGMNGSGLTNILVQRAEWRQVLQDTPMENLKLLLTGDKPHNPAELLSTQGMKRLMASLKSAFDIIIVDAPVALSIPDVAILAPEMAGVLLVHRPAKGNKGAVLEAKRILERAGAHLLGVVFNNVRPKEQKYYYHSQKYNYGSYYAPVKPSHKGGVDGVFVDLRPVEAQERLLMESPPVAKPPGDAATPC